MLRIYVFACYLLALLSIIPWFLIVATVLPELRAGTMSLGMSVLSVAAAIAYPVWIGLFAHRSWRYFRYGDDFSAAGPATLIGVPSALLLLVFFTLR